ncbi:hypothetical protein AT3G61117 [Arabidopsis thaliana]|uniref:Uncharacterized protein n=2 Tax=Arabidopsis TaxID=3701 RepID=B3H5C2_ARATH|nr:uncharacterized protein AT3G61117 [Arabidopsis thaliana]AEE80157.1 hypothetical protein AT3G61117 [Arabidopsis thaliana]|eukprot:NP_001118873.1 hypothetical protein AT3G61117 [Arabidopsis thaliana]
MIGSECAYARRERVSYAYMYRVNTGTESERREENTKITINNR